nr:Zinc finger protein 183 (ZNF183) [Euglena gracilis]|eukprot:EG_transcript_18213
MFKRRQQHGCIRPRPTATEEDEEPKEPEASPEGDPATDGEEAPEGCAGETAPKRRPLPSTNPNVHRLDKKRRRMLAYDPATPEDDGVAPSAKALATATTQIDSATLAPTANRYGPIRAPNNVRVTMWVDYKPDICKDYYETGYCSFGDSCKFAHIREDYKSGYVIEQEYEAEKRRKEARLRGLLPPEEDGKGDSDDDGLGDLPHACFICRSGFKDPVVTRCKHYFCEQCAMEHFRITQRCAACEKPTHGIFNTAHDLIKKLALAGKKEGPAGAAGEAGEAGEAEGLEWQAEAAPQLCASSWQMPHDFADSRKGKSSWL